MILRPCLLVLDVEHANSISTRKLVFETAKLNVITAYSCKEGLAELDRFPAVDAIVLNGSLSREAGFEALVQALERHPAVKVVVVGDYAQADRTFRVDAQIENFAPARLLAVIQEMFPAEAHTLSEHETVLEKSNQ